MKAVAGQQSAYDDSYLDGQRVMLAASTTGEYIERRDVVIACCGLPADALNFGYLRPPHGDVAKLAGDVRRYFDGRDLAPRLVVRSADSHPELEATLRADGWERLPEPSPGLGIEIPKALPAPPAELEIARIETASEIAEAGEVAFRAFGFPTEAAPLFLNERLLATPRLHFFAGRVEGRTVCTSLAIETRGVAGIYWVSTDDGHRGRGYGEAITWAAVAAGRAQGCERAYLQASSLGRPVYERMGFEAFVDYEPWGVVSGV